MVPSHSMKYRLGNPVHRWCERCSLSKYTWIAKWNGISWFWMEFYAAFYEWLNGRMTTNYCKQCFSSNKMYLDYYLSSHWIIKVYIQQNYGQFWDCNYVDNWHAYWRQDKIRLTSWFDKKKKKKKKKCRSQPYSHLTTILLSTYLELDKQISFSQKHSLKSYVFCKILF